MCICSILCTYSLKNFRLEPIDSIANKKQHLQEVLVLHLTLERSWRLFILSVNLLTSSFTCFVLFFLFWSVLSALHETDGGIYIFHVIFVFRMIKSVLMVCHDFLLLFLIFWFSNIELSLIIFLWTKRHSRARDYTINNSHQVHLSHPKKHQCFFSFFSSPAFTMT